LNADALSKNSAIASISKTEGKSEKNNRHETLSSSTQKPQAREAFPRSTLPIKNVPYQHGHDKPEVVPFACDEIETGLDDSKDSDVLPPPDAPDIPHQF